MVQFFALVMFMFLAFGIMAAALHFSQWKKKEESCCGGGHCSTTHNQSHEEEHTCSKDHSCATGTCYSSKEDFVNNFEQLKTQKIKIERLN